jgi:hypothetical protein
MSSLLTSFPSLVGVPFGDTSSAALSPALGGVGGNGSFDRYQGFFD